MVGRLVLVVGPSGAGKDSVIDGARRMLAGRSDIIFAQRTITRPADAGNEAHSAVTEAEFAERVQRGEFGMHWTAHGLSYGIPASTLRCVDAGKYVVVNTSRGIIEDIGRNYLDHIAIVINANPHILRQRLKSRGRESDAEIEARIARAAAYNLQGKGIVSIDNSGPLHKAIQLFIDALDLPESM